MQAVMNRAMRRAEKKQGKAKPSKIVKAAVGACSFFAQLAMCRPQDAGPIPGDGSNLADYAVQVRTRSINNVRAAILRLTEGVTDKVDDAMILAEAFGVSTIRAIEIAGPDANTNPVLQALYDGQRALQAVVKRHGAWQKWEMLGPEREAVDLGVEWYVDLMLNSTPQQMEDAFQTHYRMRELLKRRT